MRFERLAPERAGPATGAMLAGVLALGAVLAAAWFRLGLPRPICVFREWTGLSCPTCGSTRMLDALLSGDLLGAAAWNPLAFTVLAGLLAWGLASAVRLAFGLPVWRVVLAPRERLALRILAAAALVAGWAYLVWRGV